MARDEQSAGLTPTILVVEDDDSLRHSLRFSLAVEGFAVRTYAKASELLGAAELPDRGCLVVDYNLPDMTGLDLVAQLRNRQVALLRSSSRQIRAESCGGAPRRPGCR
jgi:FixJ family two-component response regulator